MKNILTPDFALDGDDFEQEESIVEEIILEEGDVDHHNVELQRMEDRLPEQLHILPTQRPIFPGMGLPLQFQGADQVEFVKEIMEEHNGMLGMVYPEHYNNDEPNESEFHEVGTAVKIFKVIPTGQDEMQCLAQGLIRFVQKKEASREPRVVWEVDYRKNDDSPPDTELKAYLMAISTNIQKLLKGNRMFQEQINMVVSQLNYNAPAMTLDLVSNVLTIDSDRLQDLLETFDRKERAKKMLGILKEEIEVSKIKERISGQVNEKLNKQQREFFLREQLKAIKEELGIEKEGKDAEIDKLEESLDALKMPEESRKQVMEDLNKLKMMNPQSPEFNTTLSYLQLVTDLPWGEYSDDNDSIKKAREVLDSDHYGLTEVKELILEFLSTVIKRGSVSGSIICLVGPPGVGKTSIGKSIASALGREFFRFSVGGMRDEAEIKGHRRTYVGAMPGKLIQALKRLGTSNPVIMLDEIDKIGTSFRGDPASALLEVLDPEQNDSFLDHYLDVPYDLSNVLFVTTANQLDTIPRPLLDRMEIISVAGYIQQEKVEIAKQYLIPKQLKEQGFAEDEISFTDDALAYIANRYAREAGVRNLEKQIRKIIRKINLKLAEEQEVGMTVDKDDVETYLGKPIYKTERLYNEGVPGVALGLAYTQLGGATLYIEANGILTDKGSFQQTGQLGDVMKESSRIALSYVRSLLSQREPDNKYFEHHSVHLHVPAGATPKDGPSAGITMALALYSLATQRPVRTDIAMTGELTLTGKVLPIGGVKEKTIGARRVGIKHLILPDDNRKDFEELADHLKEGISVTYADYFDDVLAVAFEEEAVEV